MYGTREPRDVVAQNMIDDFLHEARSEGIDTTRRVTILKEGKAFWDEDGQPRFEVEGEEEEG